MLVEFNLHLQANDQLCSSMTEYITVFPNKLELFVIELNGGETVDLLNILKVKELPVNIEKCIKLREDLILQYDFLFPERLIQTELNLLSDP